MVNQLLTSSLESDLILVQAKYRSATDELEQKSSHLVATILANNKLATLKDQQGTNDDGTENVHPQSTTEEEKKVQKTLETLKEVYTVTTQTSLLKNIGVWVSLPRSFVHLTTFS